MNTLYLFSSAEILTHFMKIITIKFQFFFFYSTTKFSREIAALIYFICVDFISIYLLFLSMYNQFESFKKKEYNV